MNSSATNRIAREPQRIMQTEFGPLGNCQSACLAMMLGLPLADVPNFTTIADTRGDNAAYMAQAQWLHDRGWALLTIVKWQALPWPPTKGFYIAGGVSPRGNRHSVIYHGDELWHDPHPEGGGIASVDDIDVLFPLESFALAMHRCACGKVGVHCDPLGPVDDCPYLPENTKAA